MYPLTTAEDDPDRDDLGPGHAQIDTDHETTLQAIVDVVNPPVKGA